MTIVEGIPSFKTHCLILFAFHYFDTKKNKINEVLPICISQQKPTILQKNLKIMYNLCFM